MRKNKETPRDYYANGVVWKAVHKRAVQELKAMNLAYLTGQRSADVLAMRKDDVEGGCVRKPPPYLYSHELQSGAVAAAITPYAASMRSAARSAMTTQGAIVLPMVIRGMIEASAMRNLSIPYTRS